MCLHAGVVPRGAGEEKAAPRKGSNPSPSHPHTGDLTCLWHNCIQNFPSINIIQLKVEVLVTVLCRIFAVPAFIIITAQKSRFSPGHVFPRSMELMEHGFLHLVPWLFSVGWDFFLRCSEVAPSCTFTPYLKTP